MQIQMHELGDVVVLRIEGEIDLYNSHHLRDHIKNLISDGRCKVIANLERVPYIDSSGIGTVISGIALLKKEGGGMKLCHLSEFVARVFRFIEGRGIFEIYETESQAVEGFRG